MSQAALLVACLSLVISGLALGWQIAMWLLNGGRVTTQLKHGVVGRGGVAEGAVKQDAKPLELTSLRSQGWDGPEVLGVQVTNTGRARVQVTAFGIRQGTKGMAVNYPLGNAFSPSLPTWIEPGSSASWCAEIVDGTALIAATKQSRLQGPSELRVAVTLGTGKTIVTRRCLRIDALSP